MKDFNYFGLFLDEETKKGLLDVFNTYLEDNSVECSLDKIYIDHCTLLHVSQLHDNQVFYDYLNARVGEKFSIIIHGIGISDKAAAFKIVDYSVVCANKIPHITIATFNGGKPVNSNNITEWKDIEPIVIETTLKKV